MQPYNTLPSNGKDFPDNSNSTYTVKLDRPLKFHSGQWMVGLADIVYPKTWDNITIGEISVRKLNPVDNTFNRINLKLRTGRYESMTEVLAAIQRSLAQYKLSQDVLFFYDGIRNVTLMEIKKIEYQISLSLDLAEILGFKTEWIGYGKHRNTSAPSLNRGLTSLYVYSDIADPRPVGDVSAPLLRIVPIENGGRFSDAYKEFRNIHYIPISNTSTDLVHVLIRDDTGAEVPFRSGKVVITLHFKQVA